ncbi:hypothetical protein GWK47_052737 [Chionoecetes opilio]|uniref:Uncharacterized protein n=1 Tax=Chionoecetes opilio TaxID=41210 RepID=A0A8J5C9J9_CHIOP|nr:hypothetical protein GWK47_052737 [Chionoecetes opilio]
MSYLPIHVRHEAPICCSNSTRPGWRLRTELLHGSVGGTEVISVQISSVILQDHIKILGVSVDRGLCFDHHVAAAVHQRLDAVQRRALRLVGIDEDQQSSAGVTSLEHRWDVSALVVCHKVQVQEVPHLSLLRLPPRAVQRWSRTTPLNDVPVKVPLSHSRQHQRTYTARTSRLWNLFAAATPDVQNMSTHYVKLAAHRWREAQTSLLVM